MTMTSTGTEASYYQQSYCISDLSWKPGGVHLASQAATCQAPLLQRFTDNASAFRIPFGDHPLNLERHRED